MAASTRVFLWSLPNPVIIVPAATGIIYCNQVDGSACGRRELEGYLVPLPRVDSQVFSPDWWEHDYHVRGAGDADAWAEVCKRIELVLAGGVGSGEAPRAIAVVPHDDNVEAWIHVAFDLPQLDPDGTDRGVVRLEGVLTWENCD